MLNKQNRKKVVGVSLTPEEIELLDGIAADQKRNRSQTIAWLAAQYVKVNGLPAPQLAGKQPEVG